MNRSLHPHYADIFCDVHETWSQEEVCPQCYAEYEEEQQEAAKTSEKAA